MAPSSTNIAVSRHVWVNHLCKMHVKIDCEHVWLSAWAAGGVRWTERGCIVCISLYILFNDLCVSRIKTCVTDFLLVYPPPPPLCTLISSFTDLTLSVAPVYPFPFSSSVLSFSATLTLLFSQPLSVSVYPCCCDECSHFTEPEWWQMEGWQQEPKSEREKKNTDRESWGIDSDSLI